MVEPHGQEPETRYRQVVELSPDGIFIGRDFRIEYANPAALKMLGASSADAVVGRSPFDLIHPDSREQLGRRIEELRAGQALSMTHERLIRLDGTIVDVELTGAAFEDGHGRSLQVIVRDITERTRTVLALRESEERLRLAFAGAQEGVWDWNLETGEVVYSAHWKRMLGYADDAIEPHVSAWEKLLHPEDRARAEQMLEGVRRGETEYAGEFRLMHRDGHFVDVLSRGFAVRRDSAGPVVRIVGTHFDLTERKRAEAELEGRVKERTAQLASANASLQRENAERERVERARRELLARLVFVQEDERRRIAREMHDQFGEQLTALGLHIRGLKDVVAGDVEASRRVDDLGRVAQALDRDVDQLVWALRPTALDDLGLRAALANYLQDWSLRVGVPAELHTTGLVDERLATEIETSLYRIAQEALTNIAKHARATHVAVLLERRADFISLVVEDDGVGFEGNVPRDASGFGLLGMQERAALVGASLDIESGSGSGTSIIVRIATTRSVEP